MSLNVVLVLGVHSLTDCSCRAASQQGTLAPVATALTRSARWTTWPFPTKVCGTARQ